MYHVTFIREKKEIDVEAGTTVLEALRAAGLTPDAPCGGAGTCGKCQVQIDGQKVKACQVRVERDLLVETLEKKASHRILKDGVQEGVQAFAPGIFQTPVHLRKAEPGEARSDWERMLESLSVSANMDKDPSAMHPETSSGRPDSLIAMHPVKSSGRPIQPDLALASSLYERRQETEEWYAVHTREEILDLYKEEVPLYLAAFDIGTTTVVGFLLDGRDGRTLAIESTVNPQVQYGADVIMRANYAQEHGTCILQDCIVEKLNEMLKKLAAQVGAETSDIFQMSVVGNTCMQHLFLGISPASLSHAPYTPAIRQSLRLRAIDQGLHIHPKGQLLVLPDIAGYVGADTCGCLLAVHPDQKEEITLMLDIGTNGEMVLGNKDRLVTCSTAAGPAFEGAKITCGMRGASGAVDHVFLKDGQIRYTTVDDVPAVGICGSGLIDLVAVLLQMGRIDDGGRLASGQEDPQVFVLVPPEESGNQRGVFLNQKDVREVQLAKAAIAAGIQILMEQLGITEKDIAKVYLAGAFGNYMNPKSAGAIGMIPTGLTDRIEAVGNAAGEGARIALCNEEEFIKSDALVERIEFVELAAMPQFQDCFVDELGFPDI
jgi:uncharacterized 2Fe-2S/4Fe-4S cluster protein (DUF4445 family)